MNSDLDRLIASSKRKPAVRDAAGGKTYKAGSRGQGDAEHTQTQSTTTGAMGHTDTVNDGGRVANGVHTTHKHNTQYTIVNVGKYDMDGIVGRVHMHGDWKKGEEEGGRHTIILGWSASNHDVVTKARVPSSLGCWVADMGSCT